MLTVLKYEPQGRRRGEREREWERKKDRAETTGMCFLGNKAADLVVGQHTAPFKSF